MAAPLTRKSIPSPNKSSRGGASVRLIVIHTAEGATTIESLGNFFKNPSSQVSSHVGADDKLGVIGEYVPRGSKAWTQANYNPVAVAIEMCGFAKWSSSEWTGKHASMLDNCARWIAEESKKFGVPITRLSPGAAQGSGRGVCSHKDLGAGGGNHSDPGAGFPWDHVLSKAKSYAGGAPAGGGGKEDMGYPQWFWDWVKWYLTTSRDPKQRPKSAPEKIPKWAWDGMDDVERVGKAYGMTGGEVDWMDWLVAGKPPNKRPNVPDKIPERWWKDNDYVTARAK